MKQIDEIKKLVNKGLTYKEISERLNIPVSTIKTCIRRLKSESECLNCGKKIISIPHKKSKKFCSDECRFKWWSKNRNKLKLKTLEKCICIYCHKEFDAQRNAKRKYCSFNCYINAREDRHNG